MNIKIFLENHIRWINILLALIITTCTITWTVSHNTQVSPRDREIASLREELLKFRETNKDLSTANDPYKKRVEELFLNNTKLELDLQASQENIKQWQDTLAVWQTQNSDLKKSLGSYSANCSIVSEIREIDNRKSTVDKTINFHADNRTKNDGEMEEWKRQSSQFQDRILDLGRKLHCQG